MENTTVKQYRIAIITFLILLAGTCAWSIFSIYHGALTFHKNPIDSNVFNGGEWFGGLFILGFIISLCTGFDDYKAVDTYADGHKEENVTDGCIATLVINFLMKPALITVIIYYVLYFLIEAALFLLPYIAVALLIGGIILLYFGLSKLLNNEKKIPLIITMICFGGIYGCAGYFLSANSQAELPNILKKSPATSNDAPAELTAANLKGSWKLISETKNGQAKSPAACTLIITDTSAGGKSYKMTETTATRKHSANYSLLSNTIVMQLEATGDNMENQYSVMRLDGKTLILTFVYLPEETISGELEFRKE